MSARILQQGSRHSHNPRPGAPKIVCIEDVEHTARCVAAIRQRREREWAREVRRAS